MRGKTDRNKTIMRMRDVEGRTFQWISVQLGCTERNVRKIYHREKAYETFAKQKLQEGQV
jgi:DNA-directed RNA polymerase specialized sigma24 family protein